MTAQTDTLAPEVEYHRVLAGDQRRIGRGILAIVLLIGGMFFLNILFAAVAVMVNPVQQDGGVAYTPLLHAAGMASVALLTPWSMLIQRWPYGGRARRCTRCSPASGSTSSRSAAARRSGVEHRLGRAVLVTAARGQLEPHGCALVPARHDPAHAAAGRR